MWKAYKYTYYWLYTWQKKLWGEVDLPQYNVILGLSLSFIAIIMSFFSLLYIAFDIHFDLEKIPKEKTLAFGFVLLLIHYFLFVYKGKYKKIEQEFKEESIEERKRKGIWVLLYTFGSLAFFIFLMFFGIWVKHG
jgi:hypothetical protein